MVVIFARATACGPSLRLHAIVNPFITDLTSSLDTFKKTYLNKLGKTQLAQHKTAGPIGTI